jgi:PAS domain S-box-containing protein
MPITTSTRLDHSIKKSNRRSINKDLTVLLVLVVLFVSMVTICFNYYYISYHEKNRLKELAGAYLSYLTQSLEMPIWTLDYSNANKIAESYFNNEQVETLKISEKKFESPNSFSEKVVFDRNKSNGKNLLLYESDIFHNGKTIGHIRLGITQKILKQNLINMIRTNIITMLLIVLSVALMTSILLRLFLKKPLDILMVGINRISKGDYDYPLMPVKQKEFQSILSNFMYMANQIQRREKALADVNLQLEIEVSQKNKAQDEIRQREAQLRAIFESSADGILVISNDGDIINANDRFYRMWQIPDELKKQHTEGLLSEFIIEQLKRQEIGGVKSQEIFRSDKEGLDEIYLKDGRIFERFSSPLILGGKSIGRVWNFTDITDRKRSFQALRESEARFRQLSDAALEAIVIHDNGIILQANEQFFSMFGLTRKEVIGRHRIMDYIASEHHQFIVSQDFRHPMSFWEVDGMKKGGLKFPIVIRNKEMSYFGKKVTVSIVRDISERKAAALETQSLKEKLARSKKMEVLGLLAGGVAHDLNNILSGIVSYPELLLMKEGLDDHTRKALKTIQESGERAAAVVNDLTTISRGIASNKEALNINSIVLEYLDSPEFHNVKLLHPNVRVLTELEPELFNISGSRLHIRKCIMNLIVNAYEAIEHDGTIIISTINRYLDKPLKVYSDIDIGEYALLTVFDSGVGISQEEIDRIFEPFYTKKVMGRSGTGLGLTVVWNTVQDHNGYINLTSGKDGTKFDLYFPITRENIKECASKLSLNDFFGNGEKILIVDDEKNQRDIACQMLDALGYKAQSVASGEDAIEFIKSKKVDLIVLDMIMPPGMNGLETYKLITRHYPGLKAIIASGFSITEDVKSAQDLGAGIFLKKPYSFEKLGYAVKQELSRHS